MTVEWSGFRDAGGTHNPSLPEGYPLTDQEGVLAFVIREPLLNAAASWSHRRATLGIGNPTDFGSV